MRIDAREEDVAFVERAFVADDNQVPIGFHQELAEDLAVVGAGIVDPIVQQSSVCIEMKEHAIPFVVDEIGFAADDPSATRNGSDAQPVFVVIGSEADTGTKCSIRMKQKQQAIVKTGGSGTETVLAGNDGQ